MNDPVRTLVISFPLEQNDLEETDFEVFKQESDADSAMINIFVERSISEEESYISRMFSVGGEYFKVEILDLQEPVTVDTATTEAVLSDPQGKELEALLSQYINVYQVGRLRFIYTLMQQYEIKKKLLPQR